MRKGKRYEDLAVEHLKRLGYRIVVRNLRCRFSEVDVVVERGGELFGVEVKGGKENSSVYPLERINKNKVRKILECLYEKFEGERIGGLLFVCVLGDKVEVVEDLLG